MKSASLRQIAAEIDVARTDLSDILRENGCEVWRGRSGPQIDSVWIREQYLTKKKTLGEIGRELGVAQSTISRVAKASGIPMRPRGGSSHASAINEAQHLSEPLRSALRGQSAMQRVRRFQTMAQCKNISESSRDLGISANVAISQLQKLERDVGGQLIQRTVRGLGNHSQQVTMLGRLLLEQADDYLGPPV